MCLVSVAVVPFSSLILLIWVLLILVSFSKYLPFLVMIFSVTLVSHVLWYMVFVVIHLIIFRIVLFPFNFISNFFLVQ